MQDSLIKLTYVQGLQPVVLQEISHYPSITIRDLTDSCIYLQGQKYEDILSLRSIIAAYTIIQGDIYTPRYLSKHKSLLGRLIESVCSGKTGFTTFKISCAGENSPEVKSLKRFVTDTYKLTQQDEADLDIYIGKVKGVWEFGVRITSRPLSLRSYKVENIKGALNPTIAYAMNTFCDLVHSHSYLNIFSGSATLLIEAGISNPLLILRGFDSDGTRNASAIANIKAAGLLKCIHLETADIFTKIPSARYDSITSDLPFGMQISETDNLPSLYTRFFEFCKDSLSPNGTLVAYTSQTDLFEKIIAQSAFKIDATLTLTLPTTVSARTYLHPKIFICSFK